MRKPGHVLVALVVLAGALLVGGIIAHPGPTFAQATITATTTDALNLRTGPSTSYDVITVMPAGSTVTLTGYHIDGYHAVRYGQLEGWAFGAFLIIDHPSPFPDITAVTTDTLNLRAGPSVSMPVIAVMPAGTTVLVTGRKSNGYLSVLWHGRVGWAHGDYLDTAIIGIASTASTTDRLNLRMGPGTSYTVMAVMPAGVRVSLSGQRYNGYLSVTWNGQHGWVFGAYLHLHGAPPPGPDPVVFKPTDVIDGPARGSVAQAVAFARNHDADRLDEVERYIVEIYRLAPQVGLDPAILVAQSAHETGNWHSYWWNHRLNPAGLGITGDVFQELLSQTFPSGTLAARAQIAHMHAEVYGSSKPLPGILHGVDDTYRRVFGAGWAGTIHTIADLAGTWAADPSYHHKLARKGNQVFGGPNAAIVDEIIEQLVSALSSAT